MYLFDSLQNLVSGLGTGKDKRTRSVYSLTLQDPQQQLYAYRGDWIARKLVNIPAFDMVRAWRDVQADAKTIEALEAEERRLQIRAKVLKALKWSRLFGGSAIILGVRQGLPSEPLNIDALGKGDLQYAHVVSRYELGTGDIDRDPMSPTFGGPKYYRLSGANGGQVDIHPSRVLRFGGEDVPEFGRTDTWGDSVLLSLDEAVKNAGLAIGGIASLISEAKVDVFKIKNLTNNVRDPAYVQRLQTRFGLANEAKSTVNALVVDAEEEWEQKQISFNQLPDLARLYLSIAAAAGDIPATRFLSQSPDGMNATGAGDMKNYHDRLGAEQEMALRPVLEQLDEITIRSATGARPDDFYWSWAPLEQMSEKEQAEIFKLKADGARAIAGNGGTSEPLMPIEALSDALVNSLVEDGSLPGLEAAIEEYGKLSEQEEDETEEAAALGGPGAEVVPLKTAANDAAPRTLYVQRKLLNAAEVIAWAKGQGFTSTLPAEDMHVTVTYSRARVDWMKMGENWSSDAKGNLTIEPGGARIVEPLGDKGAVVLLFNSSHLSWRHEHMRNAGASFDFPEYQPHVTLTYEGKELDLKAIEPYRGKLVFGPEIFEELDEDWSSRVRET